MRYLLSLAVVAMLFGCASAPVPYDQQFSTLDTVDHDGVRRSHAWVLTPSIRQRVIFAANARK